MLEKRSVPEESGGGGGDGLRKVQGNLVSFGMCVVCVGEEMIALQGLFSYFYYFLLFVCFFFFISFFSLCSVLLLVLFSYFLVLVRIFFSFL